MDKRRQNNMKKARRKLKNSKENMLVKSGMKIREEEKRSGERKEVEL